MKKNFKEIINKNWLEIFNEIDEDIFEITENSYNELVNSNNIIFPFYENIFNFTNYTLPNNIKVCIIGQDPYHSTFQEIDKTIPQATGLAFSVPKTCKIPPSLNNIYENLLKFKHIIFKPEHGNLEYWAYQDVLLLNSSLTVIKSKPNSNQGLWSMFTDELISIISNKYEKIIFVLWGKDAFNKLNYGIIKNKEKHYFIISSHPSPLSANNKFREYNSFMNTDHFGLINEYLKNENNKCIDWQII